MGNLRKFRKFIISSISRFGNIKEMWYKIEKWAYINPNKSGHAFAE